MKQFTRCKNCRQWYLWSATTPVEIHHGETLRRITRWCLQCIEDAERRSTFSSIQQMLPRAVSVAAVEAAEGEHSDVESPEDFQRCIQEHLHLMERALHEDEAVLVAAIEDFLQRCRLLQEQQDMPERVQRLQGCLQYWETFLRALNQ